MKRKWGARMSLAVGTFPRPGGGRCPGLLPLSCARGAVVGGGVEPPTGVCARCRWHRPPLGAGMKRPVASPPLHNSPPGAARPPAPAGVGGGAWGSAGPLRSPGGPHCLYNVTRATRARTARAGRAAPAGVGVRGGDWVLRQVGPLTGWSHHPPRWSNSVGVLGAPPRVLGAPPRVRGAPPRGRRPPPFGHCARHGWRGGTKATRGHDA